MTEWKATGYVFTVLGIMAILMITCLYIPRHTMLTHSGCIVPYTYSGILDTSASSYRTAQHALVNCLQKEHLAHPDSVPKLHLVYDAVTSYAQFTLPVIMGAVFVFFLSVVISFTCKANNWITGIMCWFAGEDAWNAAILFTLFTGAISFLSASLIRNDYLNAKAIYYSKEFKFIQGRVTNFNHTHWGKHGTDHFQVNSVTFDISDANVGQLGYENPNDKGGAIKSGLYVRIGYYEDGAARGILRLEVER